MKTKYSHQAEIHVEIHAPAAAVWHALTDPTQIKQYFFGTNVVTDWKIGSPILFRGDWQGQAYEDKGVIVDAIPNKVLKHTYWSSFSGLPYLPENDQIVTYRLNEHDGHCTVTLTQENVIDQATADHSAANWQLVLTGLKALVEQQVGAPK